MVKHESQTRTGFFDDVVGILDDEHELQKILPATRGCGGEGQKGGGVGKDCASHH